MSPVLELPHRVAAGMCPVNGIRDLLQWRTGRDWSNPFLWGLGQGAGFAYLRFNQADPPRQVYTGNATPRQHRYLAQLFNAAFSEVENRSFKFAWAKACQAVEAGTPPILGPLDMFYLPCYPELYHQRHVCIHFFLLVGYDAANAFILDTGQPAVQTVPLSDLQPAWDINAPGLGKRNRLAVMKIPAALPPTPELIRQAVRDECQAMLHPPVNMLGIPAMRKLAHEIAGWPAELGDETAERCLVQVRSYLSSPPDEEGTHFTAGLDTYLTFLQEAAALGDYDFNAGMAGFTHALEIIPLLAASLREHHLQQASALYLQLADAEETAFSGLAQAVE